MLPSLTSSLMSLGERPSTWQPTLKAVPKISSTVPLSSRESDLLAPRMVRAISMISSRAIDFECLMFFSFLRSRGGSLRALMTSEEAEGTTETAACRFWMVSLMVTRRPFCLVSEADILWGRGEHQPSHQSLWRYLHRPSWGTDQEDRS